MKTMTTLLLVTLLFAIAAYGQSPNRACNRRSAMGAYGYSCSGSYGGNPLPPTAT